MSGRPTVQHFSDLLCVWAYAAGIRLERLVERYRDRVGFETHVCSVFPDTAGKIEAAWGARGGAAAYGAHVQEIAARFDHILVHADVWTLVRPASSTAPHLFLKAARLAEEAADGPRPPWQARHHRLATALRRAFFEEARDIATWEVQADCAADLGLDPAAVEARLRSGEAAGAGWRALRRAPRLKGSGSPVVVVTEKNKVR